MTSFRIIEGVVTLVDSSGEVIGSITSVDGTALKVHVVNNDAFDIDVAENLDEEGKKLTVIGPGDKKLNVIDLNSNDKLELMIRLLRKIELHLRQLSDLNLDERDIKDNDHR